ncbi:MAG: RES family NAD+ phosphorylase [Syntrophaceae bacterium]|nr:RES family NAD+ phosphorylase [Syntrophaceae bacterium]
MALSLIKMTQFSTWQSYRNFERTVKTRNRYFRDAEIERFLQTILKTIGDRKRELPKKKYLWRAQLGHGWMPYYQEDEYIDDIPAPYPPERMTPLVNEAIEGRANPKGIPYIYTATTKETAMAEVRPWLGSLVSVGQFETKKDMMLVDCSVHHDRTPLYIEEPNPEEREHAVWSHIDKAFSKPMTSNDRMADYVPTQIIAELFKCNGFDGLVYKSMLGEGYNVVLFDVEAAELVNCNLFELENISFSFQQAANPYSVIEKSEKLNG